MNIRPLAGYIHGAFWKVFALVAKAAFVFLIIPHLADGVFGAYSLTSTVTMLVAVTFSFGALDALPIITRGRIATEQYLAPFFHFALFVTGICLAFYAILGGIVPIAAAVAAVNLSYFVLAGIVRSTRPHYYELLTNLPTPIFVALCAIHSNLDVQHLLLLFVIANVVVVIGIGARSKLLTPSTRRSRGYSAAVARRLLKHGNLKSVSTLLLLVDFRALLLVPGILFASVPADSLAMALTLAEAVWQLGMVVVNRGYSRYCAGLGTLRESSMTALKLLVAFALTGIVFILVPIPFAIRRFEWPLIGWAIMFFASMIALLELRYFFWSRGRYDYQIIATQVAIGILQTVIVIAAPATLWLPISAVSLLCGTLALLAWLFRKAPRPDDASTGYGS